MIMRARTIPLVALLSLVATSAAADIHIEVPTEPVAAGENIQIFVAGIASAELPKAIATHWHREGTTFVAAKTWQNKPFIWFAARLPGKYLISVTVPKLANGEAVLEHAEAVITVVDGEPPPNPPIPPVPPGEISMCLILESETRTAQESAMLGTVRAYAKQAKLTLPFMDQDAIDGAPNKTPNKTPKWLSPYLEAVKTRAIKLPALVVLAQVPATNTTAAVSSVVAVEPLGGLNGAEVVELVKKHGGKQ